MRRKLMSLQAQLTVVIEIIKCHYSPSEGIRVILSADTWLDHPGHLRKPSS